MIAALTVIALATMRPTWFGQEYTRDGAFVIVFAALLAVVGDHRSHFEISKPAKSAVICISAFSFWYVVLLLLHPQASASSYLTSVVEVVGVTLAGAAICRNTKRASVIAKSVVIIGAVMSASYLISLVIWLTIGPTGHAIFAIPIPGYDSVTLQSGTAVLNYGTPQPVYPPFTPTSGVYQIGSGLALPRFLGYMREPGLMQAALMWSLFVSARVPLKYPRMIRILLIGGILGTLSTAGFGILLFTLVITGAIYSPARGPNVGMAAWRILVNGALLGFASWLAYYAPLLGLAAKQDINAGSIADRQTSALTGITAMFEHPLGSNLYGVNAISNSSINLVAEATIIGLPGFLLALFAFLRPIVVSRDRVFAARCVLPIALTALLAQPLSGAPTTWLLVVVALSLEQEKSTARRHSGHEHGRQGQPIKRNPRLVTPPPGVVARGPALQSMMLRTGDEQ